MKMTRLGKDGPQMSQFGIGAMSFAGIYGDATDQQAHDTLDACVDAGVTHIDTANVYGMGKSETMIGGWLAARPGARDILVIATKAAITRKNGVRCFDNSPEHLEAELDASLTRLGTDHVDLFYVHRREAERPIEEVAGTLQRLIDKGKIRGFGFSEIAPSSLRRACSEAHVAAVQSEYSLSTRAPELGLVQACAELGTALVAFSPVGRTFLTDAPFSYDRAQSMNFTAGNPRFMEPNYTTNIKSSDAFRALAADMGIPAAGLAIAWLIAQGDHVVPIPGTKDTAHLAELIQGTQVDLSETDLARIEKALPVGWAHGDRYSDDQWVGPERFS